LAVADGDWIIAVLTSASAAVNTNTPTAPGGWTNLVPFGTVGTGTMSFGVWAHLRGVGETSYTWSQTIATITTYSRLVFVSGADDIANWTIGIFQNRETSVTTVTNVAPSITTTVDGSLALLLSGERTLATETDAQVTCDIFTKQWFENNVDHTLFVATQDMPTAGSTGTVTVTYPNAHAKNGIAGILGIPPAPPVTIPVAWLYL